MTDRDFAHGIRREMVNSHSLCVKGRLCFLCFPSLCLKFVLSDGVYFALTHVKSILPDGSFSH